VRARQGCWSARRSAPRSRERTPSAPAREGCSSQSLQRRQVASAGASMSRVATIISVSDCRSCSALETGSPALPAAGRG
jgi:hypothetical protein